MPVSKSAWTLPGDPSANLHAAPKQYVDAAITTHQAAADPHPGYLTAAELGYTTTCPAVSAGASWTVTHNLGTRTVITQVARTASPYDVVDVRIERATTNTVTVWPDVAMASGEFQIMILKVG